jgi:bifunctional NMN adenylyltransferase/nudix hydrolase
MKKKFDYLVFIGRFQPFHYGHAKVIETALENAEHVIVLVGSSNRARDWYNPFTYDERAQVINEWYDSTLLNDDQRLTVLPLNDHLYDLDGWLTEVQTTVNTTIRTLKPGWTDYPPKVGLIGHAKDHTSYYLGLFPQWDSMDVGAFTDVKLYNSTDVRQAYFSGVTNNFAWVRLLEGLAPSTMKFLERFHGSEHYTDMCEYHEYIRVYKEDHAYRNTEIPYDASHTCVDACVIQSGHILLVERKSHPGKGLIALPGGFINPNELLLDAMLRELKEETKLKVAPRQIIGSITDKDVFDDPHRSARGRIYSHTYKIELDPSRDGLPKVKGASDARKAMWVPLSELQPEKFFEDHYFIIQSMIGRSKRRW